MRKLPSYYENPFDDILINICDYFCPYFHKLGFTPNILTTISLLFCVVTIILLLKSYFYLAAAFFIISYFFDCMDGHFARKYNQVTKFGDYYDHITDVIKMISVIYTLYYINSKIMTFLIIPMIILFILQSIHFGCQEKYYNKNESYTLSITKMLCPNNKYNPLNITRFFGCGTIMLFYTIIIIYYGIYTDQKEKKYEELNWEYNTTI